jgi:hypothetical protein
VGESRNPRQDLWPLAVAGVLIAAFAAIQISEARLASPAYDEPPHIAAGLSYFVTHEIFRANPQHPPLLKELSGLSLMAGGIRWPHSPDADYLVHGDDPARVFGLDWPIGNDLIRQNGPDRVLLRARLPMVLVAALLVVVLFLWGRQLFGARAAAAAVFVCVLDPTLLAHGHFVTTDVGAAAFILCALYALWNWIQRPHWSRALLTGLATGAALSAKFSAALLPLLIGVLMLVSLRWTPGGGAAPEPRARLKRMAIALGVIGATAFLFVQATYFFPGDLAMYLKCAGMVNADRDPRFVAYLGGEVRRSFPEYFSVAYLLKEPVAGITLAAIGLVALIRSRAVPRLAKAFLLLPPAVLFLAVSASADDLGVRYLIPALVFFFLLAGFGIESLCRAAGRSRLAGVAAAALCLWLLVAAAGVYPDHLSYFNEAACLLTEPGRIGLDGGSRCGTEWLDDSNIDWGQGLKQLKTWLDRNAPGRELNLAVTNPFPPDAYGIRCRRLAPDDLFQEPSPGLYAVSAHLVARVPASGAAGQWLRHTKPDAIVGHALYIYDIRAR